MICCVEDDDGIRNMMVYALNAAGFEAAGYPDGEAFFAALEGGLSCTLVLLDIMLPGEDGLTILHRLRGRAATASIPVILATARGTEYDKVTGLDSGADDYLAKPFGMLEMVARVRSVLRRAAPAQSAALRLGTLELDTAAHTAQAGGRRLQLTLKEYELLRLFLSHPGKVFTREQLLAQVWGADFLGETRTVDVHIGTLRSKLSGSGVRIETVRGVGYRMEEEP